MDVGLTKAGTRYALRLERRLPHPPEKVWRVLTERGLLKQWFPADVEGGWEVGAELQFTFLHGEGEGLSEDEMKGEVLAADPPRLLEFRWGTEILRCEIAGDGDGDGCTLHFSHTFDDPSWGARNAAGWEMCFENLDLLLEAGSLAKFAWKVWRPKFRRYVEKFEPEFGPQDDPPETVRPEGDA